MPRSRFSLALVSIALLVVAPFPSSPRASRAADGTIGAPAVWLADFNRGLVKVPGNDPSRWVQVTDPATEPFHGLAVAADDERRAVWLLTNDPWSSSSNDLLLNGYDFNGTLLRRFAVQDSFCLTTGNLVRVDRTDGSVWVLGSERRLRHFASDGQLLLSFSFSGECFSGSWFFDIDPARGRVWLGSGTEIRAFDYWSGALLDRIPVQGDLVWLRGLAVEPGTGQIWVLIDGALRRYSPTGRRELDIAVEAPESLARDGAGGVWFAQFDSVDFRSVHRLLRFVASTQSVEAVAETTGNTIYYLVADPRDQSVWASSSGDLRHVDTQGALLHQLPWLEDVRDMAFSLAQLPPALVFDAPVSAEHVASAQPQLDIRYTEVGAGIDPATLEFTANGAALATTCTHTSTGASCQPDAALPEGANTVTATVADLDGNRSAPAEVSFTVDTVAPTVTVTAPADGLVTSQASQPVAGEVSEAASLVVKLNGQAVESLSVGAGPFSASPVTLTEGGNVVEVVALDAAGHVGRAQAVVTLDTTAPAAVAHSAVLGGEVVAGEVRLEAPAGSVEAGATVRVRNERTGQVVTVQADALGRFDMTIGALDGDALTIVVEDALGNASSPTTLKAGLPADPGTVAPAVDLTVATDLMSATAFLYSGADPIQVGVAPGTIEARRVAVLRGAVKTRDGTGLPGVTVAVLDHPEYGRTLSRADGGFDLALNGGGVVTVQYQKPGFLPAQRQVSVPWQDYVQLPEVVLIPLDTQVTTITAGATTMQVARGSAVSDADGTRQATLLFPPGTTATMLLPDGAMQSLSALSVRATEYTVGPNGPHTMPGELPPTSSYTYAVELGVDEALAAGATTVQFSQPVIQYLENFLSFPVGGIVPVGYYDREQAAWLPSKNGRVIKVLSVTNGLADLDVSGSGVPADAATLSALGVTDAERQQLATLYAVGQGLWRVPIPHFTAWDSNWGAGPPADAEAPQSPEPEADQPLDKPACQTGSIIECQNQILGETIGLTGTPFLLHYRSDRVVGRRALANRVTVQLSGPTVPASLQSIELEVQIAGKRTAQTFPPSLNQTYTFTWDSRDVYGRLLQGEQPVGIRIGYVYPALYQEPAQLEQSFGYNGNGVPITGSPSRGTVTIWQEYSDRVYSTLGSWDTRAQGLGAWTLGVHHAYDPTGRVLYLGTGGRRSAESVKDVITTAAGGGSGGDGGLATDSDLARVGDVAFAPDGSWYIPETDGHRVRRVDPDGIITTVAGTGLHGFSGDGGPAIEAQLNFPNSVALGPDGSLYISDGGNFRIRRVGPDGVITTVAGTGVAGFSGDGGPATAAQLASPRGLAVAPDGTVYLADMENHRIRRIDPGGTITTAAGTGAYGYSGDGGPATRAAFRRPRDVALGEDGGLYIVDYENDRIRHVRSDGVITTVAGPSGSTDDGVLATSSNVSVPVGVAASPDGGFYYTESLFSNKVRYVGPDGIVTTVTGTRGSDSAGLSGDGGPAQLAQLSGPAGLERASDGRLYVADSGNRRVRFVGLPLPGLSGEEITIAAESGQEAYVFDPRGRHLRTLDTLTGVLLYRFAYDAGGRLITVEDGDGRITTIERDAAGSPTAIVAPGGQRTVLALDVNGYLASITNPAGDATLFASTAEGLLSTLTDPKGNIYGFTYDGLGRLTRDEDPAGGFSTLARTETDASHTVTLTTALNRVTTYRTERPATGATHRVTTDPSGLQTVDRLGSDGTRTITSPDGTVTTLVEGPDPRFGMQAPLPATVTVKTPGGLTSTVTTSRTVSLTSPNDPLGLVTRTDTVNINGRIATSTFDAALRTITDATAAGRQTVATLDTQGRVIREQRTGLEPISLAYDAQGRLSTTTHGTGATARVTTLGYDLLNRLTSVIDPLGRTASYTYDLAGRVTTQTLPDGREIHYTYDRNGNLTSIAPPGRSAHSFDYTPVNLESAYTPPAIDATSPTTTYTYNLDRQPTLVTRPDGQTIAMGYDAGGRLSTITLPTGQFGLGYDPTTGNLASVTAPDGGTLSYTYDGSLVIGESWGGPAGSIAGALSWTYDNDLRVASESVNGVDTVAFTYDPDSLVTQAGALAVSRDPQHGLITGTALGSLTDTRSFSSFGEVSTYRAAFGTSDLLAVQYTRDVLGRVIEKTETIGGVTDTYAYTYDLAGRLTEVRQNGALIAQYGYDVNSNRTSVTDATGTVTGSYDAQDRLLQYGPTGYTYTANGELATRTVDGLTTRYTYDVAGNLLAVVLPDGTRIEYVVDGRNRRIGKRVNGVLVQAFLYRDSLKPVAELDGAGTVVARFVYGTNPVIPDYVVKGGATYRILTDFQGSPRLVVDTTTGAIVQRLGYDAFGNVLSDTNPGFHPFGFAGGLYDPHTKLTRFGARDYDAETGRWTAKDPIRFAGGDTNLYGYVLGDPVNGLDPLGLSDCSDFVDSLVDTAENQGWPRGRWRQLNTGRDIANMNVPRDHLAYDVLGWPAGIGPDYRGLRGTDGFRPELTQGGQGRGVGRHVAAAAAGELQGLGFLIDVANVVDAFQPIIQPGRSWDQAAAEIAGNESGRQAGRDIREFLQNRLSATDLRGRLTDILCDTCGR